MHARALVRLALVLVACDRPDEPVAKHEPAPSPDAKQAAPAWPQHTSEPCGFSVRLPYPRLDAPAAPGLLDQIAAENAFEQVALIASCGDVASVSSEQDFLDVTSTVIAQQLGATETSKRALELDGRRGLELVTSIPAARKPPGILYTGDLGFRLRLYVSGRRQYQLHVLHASSVDVDALAQTFFDSFALTASAPPAAEPATWTRHEVGAYTVEAPGEPVAVERNGAMREGYGFETEHGSTGLAVSRWDRDLPGALTDPAKLLRLHFMLRVATKDVEIVSETAGESGGRPTLDVSYRPNLPMPAHIAADDPKLRKAAEGIIAEKDRMLHLRLVLTDDAIVQLLARSEASDEDRLRFFDSLLPANRKP